MTKIVQINDQIEFSQQIKKQKFLIIDFYADWCPPCKMLKKLVLDELEKKDILPSNIMVAKVNTDLATEVSSIASINTLPTVVFYADGFEKKRFIGFKPLEIFLAMVEEVFNVKIKH